VSQSDVDAWCAKNGNMTYIETCATSGAKVEDAFRTMCEKNQKAAAAGGMGMDMPMSLSAATGAVTITAAGDARATETKAQ